jgi:Mitochondrial PGP phosphatase
MEYFRKYPETGVTSPDQIAIVGDRLMTDVIMANMMGSYAVWVKDGVVPPAETSVVTILSILLGSSSDNTLEVCTYGAQICWLSPASRLQGKAYSHIKLLFPAKGAVSRATAKASSPNSSGMLSALCRFFLLLYVLIFWI